MKPLGFCLALSMLLPLSLFFSRTVHAQTAPAGGQDAVSFNPLAALPAAEWRQVEQSVDRALAWLASQQRSDGSFASVDASQPGVTSLCTMAFFARGHTPGRGPYGEALRRALNYVLQCQKEDGLIARHGPIEDGTAWWLEKEHPTYTGAYNHAISSVMLCEAYGISGKEIDARLGRAIQLALEFSLKEQHRPKRYEWDRGGWRYLRAIPVDGNDSDLSLTSWNLMFLRAAKNAGFEIPADRIDEVVAYIERTFVKDSGTFSYRAQDNGPTRAMCGAGIFSLALSGKHETEMAQRAANWLLSHDFAKYGNSIMHDDRYHYGAYYCSLAMFQMGGAYWTGFYPKLAHALITNQSSAGNWQNDIGADFDDSPYGNAYTTALASMALSVPFQLVPIYQR